VTEERVGRGNQWARSASQWLISARRRRECCGNTVGAHMERRAAKKKQQKRGDVTVRVCIHTYLRAGREVLVGSPVTLKRQCTLTLNPKP
jgi:hypothetical protein